MLSGFTAAQILRLPPIIQERCWKTVESRRRARPAPPGRAGGLR